MKSTLLSLCKRLQGTKLVQYIKSQTLAQSAAKGIIVTICSGLVWINGFMPIVTSIYKFFDEISFAKVTTSLNIVNGASDIGLVAVETRGVHAKKSLPPNEFYESAKHQILITGVSAYRTFDIMRSTLKKALHSGVQLYVMILEPDGEGNEWVSNFDIKNIQLDTIQVLSIIKNEFLGKSGFHIRFFHRMPPFTSIMIDGDIDPVGDKPNDKDATIRVQPLSAFDAQSGIIFSFNPTSESFDGYKYFSNDLRNQWKNAKERPDLFINIK